MNQEIEFEDVVEINCIVKIIEGQAHIFAVSYDPEHKVWEEKEITDFVPLDEALRIQSLATGERKKYFRRLNATTKTQNRKMAP